MKASLLLACVVFVSSSTTWAQDATKPPFKVEVKRNVLKADSGHSFGGDSRTKVYALSVQLTNISQSLVDGCELSGQALVKRSVDDKEKLVKESIKAVQIPAMKPNERITIDLGKITVRTVKWRNNEFEEEIEEWKVVCTKNGKEIAGHQSSPNFTSLSKDAREIRDGDDAIQRAAPKINERKRRLLK